MLKSPTLASATRPHLEEREMWGTHKLTGNPALAELI
jgi:hypothetical protein